jgi:hypothetical protein
MVNNNNYITIIIIIIIIIIISEMKHEDNINESQKCVLRHQCREHTKVETVASY